MKCKEKILKISEKKMKIFCAFALALMFLAVASGRADTEETEAVSKKDHFALVEKVYRASGAKLREIKVEFWGQINNRAENDNQYNDRLLETYQNFARGLGLDPRRGCLQKDKNGFVSISQVQEAGGASWQVCLQTVPVGGTRQTFAAASLTTNNIEQAREATRKMEVCLQGLGENLVPGVTFICEWPHMADRQEIKEKIMTLAQNHGAEYVEGMENEKIVSMAFCNNLYKPWLLVNGRKINLHLAVSYNNLENMTKLFIGSPLIYQEY